MFGSNCGCDHRMDHGMSKGNNNCCCLILLLLLCGCGGNSFGEDNCCWNIILILIILNCCGCKTGFGC